MIRIQPKSNPDSVFFIVNINKENCMAGKEWCIDHFSDGTFYLVFCCTKDKYGSGYEVYGEFGFSKKEDQMLFMLRWK